MPDAGKINALQGLDTLGVSLVKRGANKRTFAITKSEKQMPTLVETMQNILKDGSLEKPEAVTAIAKSAGLTDKGAAALEGVAKLMEAFADDPALRAAVAKMAEDNTEESRKAKDAKEKEFPPKKGEGKGDGDEDEDDEEKRKAAKKSADALSALPAEVRSQLEGLWKSQEEAVRKAEERVAAAEAIVKAERSLRIEREWIAKAEKELTHVPGKKPAELGKLLKSAADADEKMAQTMYESFKAASDAVKKSNMLREFGSNPAGGESMTAYDAIVAKAQQLVQKGEGSMSLDQAIEKVMKMDPSLYEAYTAEQRERARNR